MATYIYETIPDSPAEQPERFEVQQSMNEPALTRHPQSGKPVRRVIAGGYGFIANKASPPPPSGPCGGQCSCFPQN
jgi:predicted nucleic acid-binding Zn ribbon protein